MQSPSKETVVLNLLAEGDTMLCLDARHAGVHVPPHLAQNPALRLILNLNFPRPIDVTEAGISTNLSFGGRRFACYIPMEALWAVYNPHTMEGIMWPESIPSEVLADIQAQQQAQQDIPEAQQDIPATQPTLVATPRRQTTAAPEQTTPASTPSTPRQRGHLRVIK